MQIQPEQETKQLFGDSTIMDSYSKTTNITLSVTNSVLSLEGFKVLVGGDITKTGSDKTEVVTYSFAKKNSTPKYFKLEGKWNYPSNDGTIEDGHVVFYKCKLSEAPSLTINDASGDYGDCSFSANAVPLNSNGKWYDMILNATAKEIGASDVGV